MANITKITALDGTTYDIRDAQARMYGVHYVEGDTNDTAGTWTGTLENLTAYYNGLTIIYVPKVAGASTTTLNLNNIGAITCYTTNTTKLDTQYTANTPILFTYQDGYWRRADNDVNTTTISNLYHHYANYVADSAIYRYQILFERTEDKLTPLTNANNDTGTSKTMLTSVEFNAFGRIFYYVSATTVEANGSVSAGSLCFAHESFNARYTFNCGTTLTAHKNFYLVVTPTTGNMCTIASSSPWAQELPSVNDGNWYILIGRAYSTYQVSLYPLHPVYMYDGTKVIQVMPNGFTASSMIGATSSADGASGLVPKPVTGDNTKFLRGDGTWQTVSGGGANIDDTAGAGDTDKAWSADKLTTEFGGKADKADTVLTTTLSRGRLANSTVGTGSFAFGDNVTASRNYSFATGMNTSASASSSVAFGNNTSASGSCAVAFGNSTTAFGSGSLATGLGTEAAGTYSVAEGSNTKAYGEYSHTEGKETRAYEQCSHVGGKYNSYFVPPDWEEDHAYTVGDLVYRNLSIYVCLQDHTSGGTFTPGEIWKKWDGKYAEIIGNGTAYNALSNARALDWDGNEYLKGDVYVGCDADSTGGTKLEPVTATTVKTALGTTSGTTNFLREDGTWQPVSGGGANIDDTAGAGDTDKAWSADKLTTEFGGKTNKVSNATNNNLAALDSNGNLKDSGVTQAMYKGIPITVRVANISSLPATITCSAVNANHVCIWNNISSSYVQSDWKIVTAAGSFTITGTKADGTISTAYFTFVDISGYYTGTVS